LDLAAQTVRRLSGITTETSPVFNLSTQFGGGKTHALTLLYHLAKGNEQAKEWEGVSRIMEMAGVKKPFTAQTATFVGTEFSSVSGRGGEGEPTRKTPWGELAFQIGGISGYEIIRKHDEDFVSPAGDDLQKLFDKDRSYLLLFDELLNYTSKHRNYKGLAGQFYNFMQTLTEFARSRNNIVLAVSIPASELEMTAEDQADFDRFKKMLDRLGKALFMSAEKEIPEIIRRRLFDWSGLPIDGQTAIDAYIAWLKKHETHIPSWFSLDKAREAFESSYPFHPNVLSLFERKWQSLPRFQQTRGALRLLALWVSRLYIEGYKNNTKDILLSLGTAPLEDPVFRAAVFEQMGENRLEAAVTTDIAGKSDSHAVRFDQDSIGVVKKLSLHKKSGTIIFFESNGGQTADKLCTIPEIKLNLADPDLDIGLVDTVLQDLVDGCYYLTASGNKYKYSTQENLIKRFSDRKATVSDNDITETINQEVKMVFSDNSGVECVLFPTLSNQVPDRPALSFFILDPENPYRDGHTSSLLNDIFSQFGSNPRVYKNGIIGVVAESSKGIKDEARKLLAWQSIEKDAAELHFEKEMVQSVKENINRAKRELKEQVWKSYRHLFLVNKNGEVTHIDLGLLHSSQSGTLMNVYIQRLTQDGEITEEINPNFLVRNWPPAFKNWTTKQIRDSLFSSPAFPKLKNPDSILSTISKGIANNLFAYCQLINGKVENVVLGKTIPVSDLEISDEVAILLPEEARRYEEPRKLSQITIIATKTTLAPSENIQLKAEAYDQFNEVYPVTGISWNASLGTITPEGHYTSPAEEGTSIITVSSGQVTNELTLLITSSKGKPSQTDGGSVSLKNVSWTGEVPATKWMIFYNKVLAKNLAQKDFKVTVSFQFVQDIFGGGKTIEELKNDLKELGLDSNIDIQG